MGLHARGEERLAATAAPSLTSILLLVTDRTTAGKKKNALAASARSAFAAAAATWSPSSFSRDLTGGEEERGATLFFELLV